MQRPPIPSPLTALSDAARCVPTEDGVSIHQTNLGGQEQSSGRPNVFTMPLGGGFVSTAQCPVEEHDKCHRDVKGPPSRGPMPALPRTDASPREGKKYISREQVSAPCQTWDCRSVPRPSSYVIHGLCRLHLLTKLCLFYSCIVTWYCTHSSLVGKTDLLGRGKG